MGGKAFSNDLPSGSFPRLPSRLYQDLKDRLTPLLRTIYTLVEVPPETPGKKDHGDIDFVVAQPIRENGDDMATKVGQVLGAVKSVEMDGNRTSNYALELNQEDCMLLASNGLQSPLPIQKIYLQVDVRVCLDAEEWELLKVMHGYGDLGIIIASIARCHNLILGTKGLKVSSPPPDPAIYLSKSPHAILEYMGLSMDRWKEGFTTVEETFIFASTSRFFDPRRIRRSQLHSFTKSLEERAMYHAFTRWAQSQSPAPYCLEAEREAVEEALVYFGKKGEWDAAARARDKRLWLKNNFSGKLVAEWTGLGWRGVKAVMDKVRASAGGEDKLYGRPLQDVKNLVLESKDALDLGQYGVVE
ncbi:hypothetical protein EDD16DRAFT_765749 [Pisolithus croceorrhizus]|nr:hypothetical protein EDD16DRAFT_765749 [Pisolithus croceorrhizus]KAI6128811.1 hypothetical protein EV401DRAFT_2054945 [Pisolithus croceorrhizus]KAI6151363.1 hypothetical protein EDD17DRAFT_1491777 [Pisolithus thermaeus]